MKVHLCDLCLKEGKQTPATCRIHRVQLVIYDYLRQKTTFSPYTKVAPIDLCPDHLKCLLESLANKVSKLRE